MTKVINIIGEVLDCVMWLVVVVSLAVFLIAMLQGSIGYDTTLGLYSAGNWHATVGELIEGIAHYEHTNMNIFEAIGYAYRVVF